VETEQQAGKIVMRALLSSIICAALAAAPSTTAGAAPVASRADLAPQSAGAVLVDARCGHGWHYVPAGYAKHGKWRDAHCSRN
jgi:hypothetical protein